MVACVVILGGTLAKWSWGQPPGKRSTAEAAICQAVVAYSQAFSHNDASALANSGTPDTVYLSGVEVFRTLFVAEAVGLQVGDRVIHIGDVPGVNSSISTRSQIRMS